CNPDPMVGQRYPTYWPVGTAASEEASGLAKYMSLYGYQSAFVISSPGNGYFEALTSYFRTAAKQRGIQLTGGASIATTTSDFSSLPRAIQAAAAPAAIFAAAPPPL